MLDEGCIVCKDKEKHLEAMLFKPADSNLLKDDITGVAYNLCRDCMWGADKDKFHQVEEKILEKFF